MTELMITSSVLILVVIVLRHFLKGKISLRLQYALWALVLIRLLVPVTLFESPISVMNVIQAAKYARDVSVASTPAPTLSSAYGGIGAENVAVSGGTEQNVTNSVTNVSHHVFRWGLLALKAAGLVESGVDAKFVIQDGMVKVNGSTELQRGKKLYSGDTVEYNNQTIKVEK